MIKVVLEAGELTFGYGVTANIAASHRYRTSEMKYPAGHFTNSVPGPRQLGVRFPVSEYIFFASRIL
jgi:hypothetical protein